MKISPPRYSFCPICAHPLGDKREADGTDRQFCMNCGWVLYARTAISVSTVVRRGNDVLLVSRRHPPFPGTWMFPSGFLEYGELPDECASRELLEETGLIVEKLHFIAAYRSSDDPREPNHIAMFYAGSGISGMLKNDDAENQNIGWFSLFEFPEIALENHVKVLQFLVETS